MSFVPGLPIFIAMSYSACGDRRIWLALLLLDFLKGVAFECNFFLQSLEGVFLASFSSAPGRETG